MSIVIELIVLSLLSISWLAFHGHVASPLSADVYHVAADKRDLNKSRFYFVSVWIGLIAAFLSARSLEALSAASFDSSTQRSWVMGSLRGLEMWGLLIVGAVWLRVGQRVTKPNSDGASLIRATADHSTHETNDRIDRREN
jgi:hypothetical protein